MKSTLRYLAGIAGPSGFGSNSTAEQVTEDCSSFIPSNLTALITGATSGIGAETARVLAKRGVRVVIGARNLKKAREVRENILEESPNAEVILLEIDLSSFASVQRFCSEFLALELPLNILMTFFVNKNATRENDRYSKQDRNSRKDNKRFFCDS
ncbi:Short-chain dehydrogenase/reductase SDR [Sesbania bispinosa]|nr:Short-chain dehydrogenase/reductase SDR [Sesbania bispinosa]